MAQLSGELHTDDGTTSGQPADGDYACPLCDRTEDDHDEVYSHLMINHRKSALSTALLETGE